MKYGGSLKATKARAPHVCANCGHSIDIGNTYYRENPTDRFLQTLHSKPFCEDCFKKEGDRLLVKKSKRIDKQQQRLV